MLPAPVNEPRSQPGPPDPTFSWNQARAWHIIEILKPRREGVNSYMPPHRRLRSDLPQGRPLLGEAERFHPYLRHNARFYGLTKTGWSYPQTALHRRLPCAHGRAQHHPQAGQVTFPPEGGESPRASPRGESCASTAWRGPRGPASWWSWPGSRTSRPRKPASVCSNAGRWARAKGRRGPMPRLTSALLLLLLAACLFVPRPGRAAGGHGHGHARRYGRAPSRCSPSGSWTATTTPSPPPPGAGAPGRPAVGGPAFSADRFGVILLNWLPQGRNACPAATTR